ncbi:membrane-associated phospholipid phosphatase [Desulfosporosinus orientis DSM 765]|uniref:Membrane-associated phospholipid phosphatase n=1 Tax=Desulfosporosinus orientis (strain ATCC 19365 / DSM 765 / NCIMB 8382 / VKM B-1628 / Singapore I) TaxID=768706 RepID=G7WD52_DESOD|nr:phosphatase PAP2 family protein [Desulfosporosinus orientis]AET67247.1 membrane-associated phospholipid phosphatase [Desulfosporosinus orientis DSM 765]
MNTFDLAGYHFLNQWAGHFYALDLIMAFFAQYALELYAIMFVVAWFILPKPNIEQRHALVIMGFSGILALVINVLITHVWFRPRPFVTLPKGAFTQLIPHSVDASFPSDHTAGSFGFAAGSWSKAQRWVSRSFTVLAILVAIARVYVGIHWPTDVLAGVVIGLISGKVMWKFEHFFKPLTNFALHLFRFGLKEHQARG